jgi:hypothetical protein
MPENEALLVREIDKIDDETATATGAKFIKDYSKSLSEANSVTRGEPEMAERSILREAALERLSTRHRLG